jgi:hypothetical protein
MQLSKFKTDGVIKATKGKIFSCTFTKKDGTLRKMVARLGVAKNLKGGVNGANDKNSLVTVFDMVAGGYRMINLSTLATLRAGGVAYEII